MAEVRAAGTHGGSAAVYLDGGKPFSGIVQEMLNRSPSQPSRLGATTGSLQTGDSHNCEVLSWGAPPNHKAGGIPRPGGNFCQIAIPGYKGHIRGKVAENVHGQTFGVENNRSAQLQPLRQLRRTGSAPEVIYAPGAAGAKGLTVPPRVPGYAGHIPGKHAETVHGLRFSEASHAATGLRESNPHVSCEGWMRRGQFPVDRIATYKWSNRFARTDTHDLFTPEQELESFESNKRLGQSFGLKPPQKQPHRAGDRFLHSHHKASALKDETSSQQQQQQAPPTPAQPAGVLTVSTTLDQERWMTHKKLGLGVTG